MGEQGQQGSKGDDVEAAELDEHHQDHMAFVGEEGLRVLDHQSHTRGAGEEQGVRQVHPQAIGGHLREHQQSCAREDQGEKAQDEQGGRVKGNRSVRARSDSSMSTTTRKYAWTIHRPVFHGFEAHRVQGLAQKDLARQVAQPFHDEQGQRGSKAWLRRNCRVKAEEVEDVEDKAALDDADEVAWSRTPADSCSKQ